MRFIFNKINYKMKKILLILVLFSVIHSLTSQRVLEQPLPSIKFDINYAKKHFKPNLTSRSFTESYWLNYGYVDLNYSLANNGDWGQNLIRVNSQFTKANNFTVGDLFQHYGRNGELYDILGFTQSGMPVYKTVDISKTNLKIDSFFIPIEHVRTSTTSNDKLIIRIYETSAVTIPANTSTGNGMPTSITYGTPIWADSFVWSTQLATNDTLGSDPAGWWIHTKLKVSPNLTIPAGKSFGIRYTFEGDTANYLTVLFSNNDPCNGGCVRAPAFISNTTGRQNYVFSAGTANAYDYSGTMNVASMYGCPSGSDNCDRWYPQNLMTDMFVTSTTDFNVKIDPVSNIRGCSGANLDLASSYSGMDTANTVTLKWQATGGGTFANGADTFTGGSAQYTFDTLGGFKRIILTGTGSNSEVAYDTLILENWSMNPTITATGKISCSASDSIKLAIANTAGVGISNNLVTAYDAITTRNLATNLNDLNNYFGIQYSWSGPQTYPRNDTSYTHTKTAGNYTVNITNFVGCQKSKSYTAVNTATTPPTLDFTYSPSTNICPNKDVTLKVTASALKTGWNYKWSESTTSLSTTGDEVIHQFTSSGSKSVKLDADSGDCKAAQVSKNISILSATDPKCTTVSILSSKTELINIYPNPVRNGMVYIEANLPSTTTYQVTDMLGKVVKSDKLNSSKETTIDFFNSPNGIYFIEIDNNGDKVIKKIIIDSQK